MTADRPSPVRHAAAPDRAAPAPGATASGFAELLGGVHASSGEGAPSPHGGDAGSTPQDQPQPQPSDGAPVEPVVPVVPPTTPVPADFVATVAAVEPPVRPGGATAASVVMAAQTAAGTGAGAVALATAEATPAAVAPAAVPAPPTAVPAAPAPPAALPAPAPAPPAPQAAPAAPVPAVQVAAAEADVAAPAQPAAPVPALPQPAAPAAPPVVPQSTAPLHHVPRVIGTLLFAAQEQGISHARISLRPEDLGGIEVRLQHSPAGISAQLIADSPEAARLLQQAGDDLRRSLESRDVTLLSLEVSTTSEQQRRGEQPGETPDFDAIGLRVRGDDSEDEVADSAPAPVTVLELPGGLLVDVLA